MKPLTAYVPGTMMYRNIERAHERERKERSASWQSGDAQNTWGRLGAGEGGLGAYGGGTKAA